MKFARYISIITLILHLHINAIIIESDKLETILQYTTGKKTIVAFDIDFTIAEHEQELGEGPWFDYYIKKIQEKGLHPKEALNLALSVFYLVNQFIDLKNIDNSNALIKDLQDNGISTIAVTNRSIPTYKRTIEQLKKIDIDFSKKGLSKNDIDLAVKYNGIFSQGIIFCGGNNKGKMLFQFLDKINYKPKKIVFIDDKLKNVKHVEKEVEKQNIEFVGIRFSKLDEKAKNFNIEEVEKQFEQFKKKIGLESLN